MKKLFLNIISHLKDKKSCILVSALIVCILSLILLNIYNMNKTKNITNLESKNFYNNLKADNSIYKSNNLEMSNVYETINKDESQIENKYKAQKLQVINDPNTEDKGVPILVYHYIEDPKNNNDLMIPKEKFREQMKYLKDNGYTTITLDELYSYFTNNTKLPEKPVVITMDDGYMDIYINAYPILKEFNQKATVFMITGFMNKNPVHLTSSQLIELQKNGIDIESHTVNHDELDKLTYDQQLATLKDSKSTLEKLLNKEVKYFAYPYGKYNSNTLKALKAAGYKMALSTLKGRAYKSNGLYKIHRIYIGNSYSLNTFIKELNKK